MRSQSTTPGREDGGRRPRCRSSCVSFAISAVSVAVALLAPGAAHAATVDVDLVVERATVKVAPEVKMRAWTFNGTCPAR